MKTKVNVHLISTDKPSHIYLKNRINELGWVSGAYPSDLEQFPNQTGTQNQHLYITLPQSDLEISKIKEGDWFITDDNILKSNNSSLVIKQCKEITNSWIIDDEGIGHSPDNSEKIVACTDKLPIEPYQGHYDGIDCTNYLPSIPQSFINHYITEYNKGNMIKEVEVELEEEIHNNSTDKWNDVKVTNNEISITPLTVISYTEEEVKEFVFRAYNQRTLDNEVRSTESLINWFEQRKKK
jgi:hypothetical protein